MKGAEPPVINPKTLAQHQLVPVGYNIHPGLPPENVVGNWVICWFYEGMAWSATVRRDAPEDHLERFLPLHNQWEAFKPKDMDTKTRGFHYLEPIFAEPA